MNPDYFDQVSAELERRRRTYVGVPGGPSASAGHIAPGLTAYNFEQPVQLAQILASIGLSEADARPVDEFSLSANGQADVVGKAIQLSAFTHEPVAGDGDEAALAAVQLAGSEMKVNRISPKQFLQRRFLEGTFIRKVTPRLFFHDDLAVRTVIDDPVAVWHRETSSAFDDPEGTIAEFVNDGAVPKLTVWSDPEELSVSLKRLANRTIFTDAAIRNQARGFSEVMRKMDMTAWTVAHQVNSVMSDVIASEFSSAVNSAKPAIDQVIFETVSTPWSDASSDPFEDIRSGALSMETTTGYYYEATDLYVEPTNWKELNSYATSVDLDWVKDPTTGERIMQIDQIRVHKVPVDAGIPNGSGLLLARGPGVPAPLEIFDRAPDSRFSTSGMFGVQTVFEELTRNTHVIVDREFAVVNRNPKTVAVLDGI